LRAVGVDMDADRIEALLEPYAPGTTPSATLVTNVISELTVNAVYRTMHDWVAEPVLKQLLLNASRDEAGHAREFIYYTRRRLERHPSERASVLETFHFYMTDNRIKHPVGEFKHRLVDELRGHETIDTAFEMFLELSDEHALEILQTKIRKALGTIFGRDFAKNSDIRHALAETLA
ncbi:MAG: ferritin-like domain-containing protein, partial [Frankia sp.]